MSLIRDGGLIAPGYLVAGAAAALASAILLLAAFQALFRGRLLLFSARIVVGSAMLAAGIAVWTLAFGIQGYRALTREEVAAVIAIAPLGPQRFEARVRLADGSERRYVLAGDEIYVDAQILKWKPQANLLGLHTAYQLNRIAGRYRDLAQEQRAPRTVHSLGTARRLDLFDLRQRYALLEPLVDADYGSATFVAAGQPKQVEIRVSTSGLMARELASRQGNSSAAPQG